MTLAARSPAGLPSWFSLTGGRLRWGWVAGDTRGPPVTPRERAGGLTLPAAQRLLGQLLERAGALVLPEDRDQDAGQERARDRDEYEEGPRVGHGEERPGDQDAAPGAQVADAVGPARAQRAHPGRVVLRDVHVHAPQPQRQADPRKTVEDVHAPGA